VPVYVELYFAFFVFWFILLLIFVARTSASDSEMTYNVTSGTLNLTHSLASLTQWVQKVGVEDEVSVAQL